MCNVFWQEQAVRCLALITPLCEEHFLHPFKWERKIPTNKPRCCLITEEQWSPGCWVRDLSKVQATARQPPCWRTSYTPALPWWGQDLLWHCSPDRVVLGCNLLPEPLQQLWTSNTNSAQHRMCLCPAYTASFNSTIAGYHLWTHILTWKK